MMFSLLAAVCLTASQLMNAEAHATPRNLPASPFAGCGKPLPKGQALGTVSKVTISSDGFQRSYLISVPPKYNAFVPTPLILSYHGGVRTAESQLQLDQLTNPEFNTVSMVIYPQGINVRSSHNPLKL
jgi:poly(3-hydroxybutyrate) depolymerase